MQHQHHRRGRQRQPDGHGRLSRLPFRNKGRLKNLRSRFFRRPFSDGLFQTAFFRRPFSDGLFQTAFFRRPF
ncbi:hypothetical protein ACLD9W_10025, partial [Neisseria sp. WLZKY-1]|uniref:hypothetical protein n=1 Tax=Neisseria sp. WLZKY-1 TaxID=3390377 RepID=UPI00397D6ACD